VAVILVVLAAAAGTFTATQRPLEPSSFSYGKTGEWAGFLVRVPAPALLMPSHGGLDLVWLVARGKHGVQPLIAGLPDGWIRVRGSAITREPWTMVEVASLHRDQPPAGMAPLTLPSAVPRRRVTLRGEIVDSKCFLGVMNPGERTVHRDCAVRCLSGGVTPMFAFTTEEGRHELAVLVAASGRPVVEMVRDRIGRTVDLDGTLTEVNEMLVLEIEEE
jgi:hypothetical protein